tara:strand:- start:917 stop:1534 length:618 start_codon:yes stop_codon:yes gene_type:complete
MINVPVFVVGIKRASYKANQTARHLRKYFSNVKIYWGHDIKGKEQKKEKVATNVVVLHNAQQLIRKHSNLTSMIIAEDDVRITDPDALRGQPLGKKIVRMVYHKYWAKAKNRPVPIAQGTQLTYIPKQKYQAVLELRKGHFDLMMSKYIRDEVLPAKRYGIEYLYPNQRANLLGLSDTHTKDKYQIKESADYDKRLPQAYLRYRK